MMSPHTKNVIVGSIVISSVLATIGRCEKQAQELYVKKYINKKYIFRLPPSGNKNQYKESI